MGEGGGEVWFKVDRLGAHATAVVNGVRLDPDKVLRNLRRCAALAPTWIQTCWFALDGAAPDRVTRDAYCEFVGQVAACIRGIHLYGLARPSQQAAAPRLGVLAESELCEFARHIEKKTGVRTVVSP